MEDRFQVGVITSTHGIKGEVKVFPTTDDAKRFFNYTIILTGFDINTDCFDDFCGHNITPELSSLGFFRYPSSEEGSF